MCNQPVAKDLDLPLIIRKLLKQLLEQQPMTVQISHTVTSWAE